MNRSTRPPIQQPGKSGRLNNSTGADAAGAGTDMNGTTILSYHPNSLQVWQPPTTGLVMSVADVIAGSGTFATNFTITGHVSLSSINYRSRKKRRERSSPALQPLGFTPRWPVA